MGKLRLITTEFAMSLRLKTKIYNVVGAEDTILNSNDLLFAANNDVISFVLLYHLGLYQNSTFIWLPTHAIEKFIKAYLLDLPKYDEVKLRKISHNVKDLWELYRKEYQYTFHPNIEEYINEISAISPNVRYGDKSILLNDNLLSGLIYLTAHFNKFKKGSINYPKSYYGFYDEDLQQYNFLAQNYLVGVFKAYLHLIIEHKLVLSTTGMSHPHKYEEIKFVMQKRFDSLCPICNGQVSYNPFELGMTSQILCDKIKEYINACTKRTLDLNDKENRVGKGESHP